MAALARTKHTQNFGAARGWGSGSRARTAADGDGGAAADGGGAALHGSRPCYGCRIGRGRRAWRRHRRRRSISSDSRSSSSPSPIVIELLTLCSWKVNFSFLLTKINTFKGVLICQSLRRENVKSQH